MYDNSKAATKMEIAGQVILYPKFKYLEFKYLGINASSIGSVRTASWLKLIK